MQPVHHYSHVHISIHDNFFIVYVTSTVQKSFQIIHACRLKMTLLLFNDEIIYTLLCFYIFLAASIEYLIKISLTLFLT